MVSSKAELLSSAKTFCDAFAAQKPTEDILAHFSSTHQCVVLEHGLPDLAPFLGRSFMSLEGIKKYLELVQKYLSYEDMEFSEYTVDAEVSKVCVKGKARFTVKENNQSWDETFLYMLDFDQDGKVTDWKIWADSGALFLALHGKLKT